MRIAIGTFTDKNSVESPSNYFHQIWSLLIDGPSIVQPRRCGNFEPLKAVDTADLRVILEDDYIVSNGRRFLGMVHSPTFVTHQYYSLTVLLDIKSTEDDIAEQVYSWISRGQRWSVAYKAKTTKWLFENQLALHQMLNTGLVELNLPRIDQYGEYFDHLEYA